MLLLGIDLEIGNPFNEEDGSNRKDENTWLTEVGAVLYDTEMDNTPVKIYSEIVNEGKGVSQEAQDYTGITPEIVEAYGSDPKSVAVDMRRLLSKADFVVAHNGERADKPWLKHFLLRHLPKEAWEGFTPPHWIDTMTDIEYPSTCVQRSLGYLNSYHLILNSFPHRAATDVMSMMSILFKYDLDRVIKVSTSPKVLLKAIAPVDSASNKKPYFTAGTPEYKEMEIWKGRVRKKGFRWDGDGSETGSKCWYKSSRELFINEGVVDEYDFEVTTI